MYKTFDEREVNSFFSLDASKAKESMSHFLISLEKFCIESGLGTESNYLLVVREYLFSIFQQLNESKKRGLSDLKNILL